MVVFNKHEAAHIFVEDGVVVCALANKKFGENALRHALHLDEPEYAWMADAQPVIKNVQISIQEYVLKHSIARDTKIGTTIPIPKQATKLLPKEELVKDELAKKFARKELNRDLVYYFTDEEQPTRKLKLTRISNVVGRDEYCDLILDNAEVSRKHCILQVTPRGVMIKDLDSTNGTYANGIAVTDGYINRGDRLSLGSYELTLHVEKNLGDKIS